MAATQVAPRTSRERADRWASQHRGDQVRSGARRADRKHKRMMAAEALRATRHTPGPPSTENGRYLTFSKSIKIVKTRGYTGSMLPTMSTL